MSVATVDVERVRAVVKAVIEDWIRRHGWAVSVAEPNLRELYNLLTDELKSIHIKDVPAIQVRVKPHSQSSISVLLPLSKVMCVATFTARNIDVYGDAMAHSEFASATAEIESPIEVVCHAPKE